MNGYFGIRHKVIVFSTPFVISYDFLNMSYENILVYSRPISSSLTLFPVRVV